MPTIEPSKFWNTYGVSVPEPNNEEYKQRIIKLLKDKGLSKEEQYKFLNTPNSIFYGNKSPQEIIDEGMARYVYQTLHWLDEQIFSFKVKTE